MNESLDPRPTNPLIAELVESLPIDLRLEFGERAAILEFDGELSRPEAECRSALSLLKRYPEVIAGVIVLRFTMNGIHQWVVTTDLELAGRYLAHLGAVEIDTVPLADVVAEKCGGLAALVRLTPIHK